ncbi:MAG: hypothetical protein LBR64_01590 [Dysgonamonadaceae bacterium]|jgi:hypothetical protein|nr:hypothetical protein [Dysgonamonadaceae bacterium]
MLNTRALYLFCAVLCLFVSNVQAQFESGSGTSSDPWVIKTAAQLSEIRNHLGESSDTKVYYRLANDIDLSDYINAQWPTDGWLPIGLNESGVETASYLIFDGGDHKITGLWINRPAFNHIALFAKLSSGSKVNYLTVILDEAKGGIVGKDRVGAINGYNNNNVAFTQIHVKGSVKGRVAVGGLSGMIRSRASEKVYNCYFEGTVEGVDTIGGLGGYVADSRTGYIENSYFSGTVTATGSHKGALVGLNEGTGDVTITSCYFPKDLNPGLNAVGNNASVAPDAGKTLAEMKKQATYVDWDFDYIWEIQEDVTTPYYRTEFAGGDGTAENPWLITTPLQLNSIRSHTGTADAPYYYKLADNIDMTDYIDMEAPADGWLPFGLSAATGNITTFYAVLDGDNHVIKGLWLNRYNDKVGLFAQLGAGSSIKNLGLNLGSKGIYGHNYVGALVGYCDADVAIQNVFAGGYIKGTNYIGGLAGNIRSSAANSVSNCYFIGTVEGASQAGGICGYVSPANTAYVSNCYFSGTFVTTGSNVGGIIGQSDAGAATIENCFFNSNKTGLNALGSDASIAAGANKTATELKQQATFTNWDFANIWKIDEGTSTPYFKWQPGPLLTDIKAPVAKSPLLVSVSGGILKIKGFALNETVSVYNVQGVKIYSAKTNSSELNVKLPAHGLYIVSTSINHIKVIY